MTDMARQRHALSQARLVRADHLVALHTGLLSPRDVIDAARGQVGIPLRRLKLTDIYLAYHRDGSERLRLPPGCHMSTADWAIVRTRLLDVLDIEVSDARLTVGWVVDPRAGGRRDLALVDALRSRETPPWPAFPWGHRDPLP